MKILAFLLKNGRFYSKKKRLTTSWCDKKERKLQNDLCVWRARIFANRSIFYIKNEVFSKSTTSLVDSLIDLLVLKKGLYQFLLTKNFISTFKILTKKFSLNFLIVQSSNRQD